MSDENEDYDSMSSELDSAVCFRCGSEFSMHRVLCSECGFPNFYGRPFLSIFLAVTPFLLIFVVWSLFLWLLRENVDLHDWLFSLKWVVVLQLIAGIGLSLYIGYVSRSRKKKANRLTSMKDETNS